VASRYLHLDLLVRVAMHGDGDIAAEAHHLAKRLSAARGGAIRFVPELIAGGLDSQPTPGSNALWEAVLQDLGNVPSPDYADHMMVLATMFWWKPYDQGPWYRGGPVAASALGAIALMSSSSHRSMAARHLSLNVPCENEQDHLTAYVRQYCQTWPTRKCHLRTMAFRMLATDPQRGQEIIMACGGGKAHGSHDACA
jgi:hypothetical protein